MSLHWETDHQVGGATDIIACAPAEKPQQKAGVTANLLRGAALACAEAATLGLPLEVWKTRMGRFRTESTMQSFRAIYADGGASSFWKGAAPKMLECSTKGAFPALR